MNPHFPKLFSPITLAGRQLKNRIVFPAVVSLYARDHLVTERWIDYYAERAKGGAAMLVTEGLSVHESSSPQPGVITLFDDRNDDLLRQAAQAVEQHDCRFLGQLWHVGRQALWSPVAAPVGVSDLPDAYSWSVPHVMDVDDIKILIDAFTRAAQRLQRAGFSGVELHGAHGYLIGQFLSPWSNTRTDDYGGDEEGRSRFVREGLKGTPVMAMGRIVDAAHAEQILQEGTGDLIGMARALIADAALPEKAARGEAQNVRPCVFSNVCWGEIHGGKAMACLHNPELGQKNEASYRPPRATRRKRVAVAGAGVAGLQVAWVMAARGHDVTLYGSAQPGGKARLEASLPGRAEIAKIYEYQLLRAREHKVNLVLGSHADRSMLEALAPHAVVIATGSNMRRPESLKQGAERALSLREYVNRKPLPTDGLRNAVLFDEDHTQATYAAADQLAARFQRLTIVTPRTQLGRAVPYVNLIGVYRRLYQTRVEILSAHLPISYAGDEVTLYNVFNADRTVISDVALFTYATPRSANDTLAHQLRDTDIEIHLVGDCFAPRNMMAAIHEAPRSRASYLV